MMINEDITCVSYYLTWYNILGFKLLIIKEIIVKYINNLIRKKSQIYSNDTVILIISRFKNLSNN